MSTPSNGGGPKPRVTWLSNALLLRCLISGPHTSRELVEETGMHIRTVQGYVSMLHRKRLVRICGYLPNTKNSYVIVQWEWGPDRKDVPKPAPKTSAQRSKLRRVRTRARIDARLHGQITPGNAYTVGLPATPQP